MSKAGNPALLAGEYIEDPKTGEKKLAAAVALGSIKTERKAAASRENGKRASAGPGVPPKPLMEIQCTCTAGESLEGHRWDCPRGQAVKRRKKEGRNLLTGTLLVMA
jgi:hypothetical protein